MMYLDDPWHWQEPDAGCVTCGNRYVTVADHRCADCIGLDLRRCPHCLSDIDALVGRELVRRLRNASHDVNDAWRHAHMFDRYRLREQVAQARAGRSPAA